ncbi:MAG: flagellar motor switch protein FliM [Deltaproteobacteria bacterium]|nr:flagellar motor switch protein FliM [Deltaproteobacteria bacterium]
MTEQILSQVEVDALLKGLSNGDIKTEAEKEVEITDSVRPYDFSKQERAIRGKMPALEMINEKFSRSVRNAIFNVLRKTVDVNPEGIKTMKYEEFLRNIQVPSSLNIYQPSSLRGQGLLVIDPNLVFIIVDSYFGGDGRFHTRIEGRDFTNVEQAVVKRIVDVMLHEISDVWKPVHQVDFKLVRSEMNPQFVNIMPHGEPVVVSTFRMDIETGANKFFFCLPYSSLEPIKEKIYGTHKVDPDSSDNKWSVNLKNQFGGVPLAVSGEIGKAKINVSELVNLKAGDIIQLDRKARDPLVVDVEGIHKFLAAPGVQDKNYALQILSAFKERGV